jgi:DNA-binding response OmpR family regulator
VARILLVEDDQAIVAGLQAYLTEEGFETAAADSEAGARDLLAEQRFDLLLVDVSLRFGSGFGVCAAAREQGMPVIFLTANGDENSVVAGLDMGAEDYIVKPFRPRELLSRIRGVLRRSGGRDAAVRIRNLTVDTEKGTVEKDGKEISLSALEYRLLLVFLNNRGRLLSRNRLLEEIWDAAGDFVNDNTLTVYIKRLREKIEDDPQEPAVIKTVRGLGYRVD